MDNYPAEKLLNKVFRVVFHPLLLPIYIFFLVTLSIPICRLYALINYKYIFFILVGMVFVLVLLPLWYQIRTKHNKQELSVRELLIFTLIMYAIHFFMTIKIISSIAWTTYTTAILVSGLIYLLLLLISFFTTVDLHSACILTLMCLTIIITENRTFFIVSLALIFTGLVLSIYLINQKTDYIKILISFFAAIIGVVVIIVL